MTVHPMTYHDEVEKLKAERQTAVDALYYRPANGSNPQPKYAPELMKEYMAGIENKFDAALLALMKKAQEKHDKAEAELAKVSQPYGWLTADELARAATLAPFIREDLAALDGAGVVQHLQTVIDGGDKVHKWLAHRYAPARWSELDSDRETAPGMAARANYEMTATKLRDAVMPSVERVFRQDADDARRDAETLYYAAEWARPSVRQEFAARLNQKVEYLPD